MTARAYILVKAEPGKTNDVIKRLGDVKNRILFGSIPGRYDGILFIEKETHSDLAAVSLEEVRKIDGVLETRTLFVLRETALKKERMGPRYPIKAILFAKCEPSATTQLLEQIKTEPDIGSLCAVTGEFDIAVLFCTNDAENLAHAVFRVRNFAGVKETETFVITTRD